MVITSALHAEGRQFNSGRKQPFHFIIHEECKSSCIFFPEAKTCQIGACFIPHCSLTSIIDYSSGKVFALLFKGWLADGYRTDKAISSEFVLGESFALFLFSFIHYTNVERDVKPMLRNRLWQQSNRFTESKIQRRVDISSCKQFWPVRLAKGKLQVPHHTFHTSIHVSVLLLPRRDVMYDKKGQHLCFRPELNWRPSACEADVITTTLRKLLGKNWNLFFCTWKRNASEKPLNGKSWWIVKGINYKKNPHSSGSK